MPSGVYDRKVYMRNAGYPHHIKEAVLEARKQGMSQKAAAKQFGVSRQTIRNWEVSSTFR